MQSSNLCILIGDIYNIYINTITFRVSFFFLRYKDIEQSFGLCGRGRGWDDLGEGH